MEKVLEVQNLKKSFSKGKELFAAVDGISFSIAKGECLGLVGESGCGKSTIARMITDLLAPDGGRIFLNGLDMTAAKGKIKKEQQRQMQMVFQSPVESFNPRIKLGSAVMENMRNQGTAKEKAKKRMLELLDICGLPEEFAYRYPHQVSGGQCQRAALARAISMQPSLLICDEATSALDVTVQAQITDLLQSLQKEMGMALLFICHDLALVSKICDRVIVMYQGKIVEEGITDEVILHPKEEYTKRLIEAVITL